MQFGIEKSVQNEGQEIVYAKSEVFGTRVFSNPFWVLELDRALGSFDGRVVRGSTGMASGVRL